MHPIAPLVLVTNGRDCRLYDTYTKELVTDAGAATLVRGGRKPAVDEALRLRAEALEHFIGYSATNVATSSRLQREARMGALRGGDGLHARRYEPDLYLPRDGVHGAMRDWASSTKAGPLAGSAGRTQCTGSMPS